MRGKTVTLTTTVPAELAERVERMAADRLVNKSVLIRQILLEQVRRQETRPLG